MIGHVTSSYFGARIGRSFALGLVQNGPLGDTASGSGRPLPDRPIAARICRRCLRSRGRAARRLADTGKR